LLNPLATALSLGGQFLDTVAPAPKLRVSRTPEFSLLSKRVDTRTVSGVTTDQKFVGFSVVSGGLL
jgi:hypothetical protein